MKQTWLTACIFMLLASCKPDSPTPPSETIDPAITGTWQVARSYTITGVRMRPDGSLEAMESERDTLVFDGTPNTRITSYMFGTQENIIDIRNDNKIKIFRINSKGGVTITNEQVPYEVLHDTLYSITPNFRNAHKYQLQNDSLIIERIPNSETKWTYVRSTYFKREM